MPDRSCASNTSSREISRPDAAQEVGDLAFAASFLAGLLEERSASEDIAELARGLEEHLRDLECVLSGRPAGTEKGPHKEGNPKKKNAKEQNPPGGNPKEASVTSTGPAGDRPTNEGEPDRNGPKRDKESLSAALRHFETPINPHPTFKPPLVEDVELKLSPETVETVGRAASALSPFYRGPVTADLITEVALRKLLYDLATEREESVLAEWLGRAFGGRQVRSTRGAGEGKPCSCL